MNVTKLDIQPNTKLGEWAVSGTGELTHDRLSLVAEIVDRPSLTDAEESQVLDLIAADHVAGQPKLTREDLSYAFDGKSEIDGGFWEEFEELRHLFIRKNGAIVGAAAVGLRADGSASIPWLHAREDKGVTNALLELLSHQLKDAPKVDAFSFATQLSLGLEGLPVAARPTTAQALENHGFRGRDLWLYMKGQPADSAESIAEVKPLRQKTIRGLTTSWDLKVGHRAEARIELGPENTGVIWWIEVKDSSRGQGLGVKLFRQATSLLGKNGAERIILFVDHDDPSERDRRPAISLYKSQGFEVIDHLWSYSKGGEEHLKEGTSR